MSSLFDTYEIKNVSLKNRIMMSPMCQYQANPDGTISDWHTVHYGSRAAGGPALIMVEASGVESRGRITTGDVGIYSDEHISGLTKIVEYGHKFGVKMGIQLAHAGRKSEVADEPNVAPSAITFSEKYRVPQALTAGEINGIVEAFAKAASRALKAGFDLVEIHGAHGYLIHEFLSPLSNQRTDEYGGSFENRMRFPLQVIRAVKEVIPPDMPLFMRVSAVEYSPEGYQLSDMVEMVRQFKEAGVDILDVSSGGNIPIAPQQYAGYQADFAATIREQAGIPTIAVGHLDQPKLANYTIASGKADMVAVARGFLKDAHWGKTAAIELGAVMEMPNVYRLAY